MQQKPGVLIVDADLLAIARVEAAAERAGRALVVAASTDLSDALDSDIGFVILDLDRGREPALDALDRARESGSHDAKVIAFVSHVDEDLAQRARERGYETSPRGRFWRSLDDLLGP